MVEIRGDGYVKAGGELKSTLVLPVLRYHGSTMVPPWLRLREEFWTSFHNLSQRARYKKIARHNPAAQSGQEGTVGHGLDWKGQPLSLRKVPTLESRRRRGAQEGSGAAQREANPPRGEYLCKVIACVIRLWLRLDGWALAQRFQELLITHVAGGGSSTLNIGPQSYPEFQGRNRSGGHVSAESELLLSS